MRSSTTWSAPIGTYLYGRRMYEVMVAWETMADERPFMRDYAEIWRSAEKVVFSKTLEQVESARTRIEREFDPEAVRRMKASASGHISVGGPELASQAIAAGLVDEIHLFLAPAPSEAASRRCPRRPAWGWSCWISAASPTAPSTSTTGSSGRGPRRRSTTGCDWASGTPPNGL